MAFFSEGAAKRGDKKRHQNLKYLSLSPSLTHVCNLHVNLFHPRLHLYKKKRMLQKTRLLINRDCCIRTINNSSVLKIFYMDWVGFVSIMIDHCCNMSLKSTFLVPFFLVKIVISLPFCNALSVWSTWGLRWLVLFSFDQEALSTFQTSPNRLRASVLQHIRKSNRCESSFLYKKSNER